jgi:hypothetical protein
VPEQQPLTWKALLKRIARWALRPKILAGREAARAYAQKALCSSFCTRVYVLVCSLRCVYVVCASAYDMCMCIRLVYVHLCVDV